MITDDELSQQLAALVAYEEKQWATEFLPPKLPEGAPSLARMYTAILREDWKTHEWNLIQSDDRVRKMYHNTLASVWYPTFDQLKKYADGKLPADMQRDVEHHLEVDKCLHSLRLLGWADLPESGSMSPKPFELAVESGFAAADTEPKALINDEQIRLIYDPESIEFRLSSTVLGEGTLMRVVMLGADGKQIWQRFVLLWDKFRDQVMGRCEAPKSSDDFDAESCKHNSLLCIPVNINQLKESDAIALEQSWVWAKENHSESVDAWKMFAEKLKQQSSISALKIISERIG